MKPEHSPHVNADDEWHLPIESGAPWADELARVVRLAMSWRGSCDRLSIPVADL